MTHKSDLIQIFSERGYIHQATDLDAIDTHAATSIIPTYIGFDCTADSLHVGSLVQIMMLRILQKCGHKPIVLMGGGTTKVGDPSGKDSARPLLSDQDIETNKNGIKKVFEKYLTFGDAPADALMVDNADWLDTLHYIRFLRDFGAHFSINRMMGMESVKLRLDREQNLSFLEFNYAILQAYDFLELRRRYGCMMQLGGSDQWGNIVTGIDLTRRVDGQEVFGLTSPLITTSSGAKMGKSANGAIWLNKSACLLLIFGNSGAIPKMLMLRDFWGCSPNCQWMKCAGLAPCKAPKLMMPKSFLPTMPPPFAMAKQRPKPPKPRPRQHLVIRACRMVCRRLKLIRMRPTG